MVNIIILFFNRNDATKIRNLLVRDGHNVTDICTSGAAARLCIDRMEGSDGIVVAGFRYRDMTYREFYQDLPENYRLVVLTSAANCDKIVADDIIKISMPVKTYELNDTIYALEEDVAQKRRRRHMMPRRRSPEEEKTIGDAKDILMKTRNISEPEAHAAMQRSSMNNSVDLAKVAQIVIDLFK